MISLREVAIFLAGAQTFHTLSHVWLRFSGLLPLRLRVPPMMWTAGWNDAAIALNALITAVLYRWAWRLEEGATMPVGDFEVRDWSGALMSASFWIAVAALLALGAMSWWMASGGGSRRSAQRPRRPVRHQRSEEAPQEDELLSRR